MPPSKTPKTPKIDLNREYPCPCSRKGKILPIILTEAMGCNRCQNIFVLTENGEFIEEVSSPYVHKKAWRWTGKRWLNAYTTWRETYLPLFIGIIFVVFLVLLPLIFHYFSDANIIFWLIIAILLAVLPALMVWLAYRR